MAATPSPRGRVAQRPTRAVAPVNTALAKTWKFFTGSECRTSFPPSDGLGLALNDAGRAA